MSSMYKIPPVMPEDFDVKPLDIMYSIPSYHNSTSQKDSNAECNGITEELNDPVQMIEKKQQNLIQSIKNLGSTLEALLEEMGKCGAGPSAPKKSKVEKSASPPETSKPGSKEGKVEKSASPPETSKPGNKRDKDAKKEARKAAKLEAKSKLASDSSATTKAVGKESEKPWIVHEEERATITGQSLTACLPSALAEFPIEKLGEVSIAATDKDRPWIEALSRVGEKRDVAFKGEVSNSSPNASSTVSVTFGEKFSVESGGISLTCRISAWKLLGSALGLFSFKPEYSLHAVHQHRWLSKADLVLAGKMSREETIREASKFLSQFDALGSHFRFGVADLVARTVLIGSSPPVLPNNVELWFKRMETVI